MDVQQLCQGTKVGVAISIVDLFGSRECLEGFPAVAVAAGRVVVVGCGGGYQIAGGGELKRKEGNVSCWGQMGGECLLAPVH